MGGSSFTITDPVPPSRVPSETAAADAAAAKARADADAAAKTAADEAAAATAAAEAEGQEAVIAAGGAPDVSSMVSGKDLAAFRRRVEEDKPFEPVLIPEVPPTRGLPPLGRKDQARLDEAKMMVPTYMGDAIEDIVEAETRARLEHIATGGDEAVQAAKGKMATVMQLRKAGRATDADVDNAALELRSVQERVDPAKARRLEAKKRADAAAMGVRQEGAPELKPGISPDVVGESRRAQSDTGTWGAWTDPQKYVADVAAPFYAITHEKSSGRVITPTVSDQDAGRLAAARVAVKRNLADEQLRVINKLIDQVTVRGEKYLDEWHEQQTKEHRVVSKRRKPWTVPFTDFPLIGILPENIPPEVKALQQQKIRLTQEQIHQQNLITRLTDLGERTFGGYAPTEADKDLVRPELERDVRSERAPLVVKLLSERAERAEREGG